MDYLDIYKTIIPYFGIAAIGVFFRLSGLLTQRIELFFLKSLVRFFLPCLSISFVLGNETLTNPVKIIEAPAAAFISIVTGFVIAYVVAPFMGVKEEKERRSYMLSMGVYNYGFLAIPICEVLFGRSVTGLMLVFGIGVDLAYWGVGVPALASVTGYYKENPYGSFFKKALSYLKRLVTAPLIAIIFSLSMNFSGGYTSVPDSFMYVVSFFGSFTIPLGLFASGAAIADAAVKGRFLDRFHVTAGSVVIRLLVIPLIFVAGAAFLPISIELKKILALQSAMPAGMFTVAVIRLYQGETDLPVKAIIATTAISFFTIPFWIDFAMGIIGV